jgi:hypothetical protein
MASTSKIFRYKLTDDIMALITHFAKIHQLDDRHDYKEAWALWLVEHRDYIEREVVRLNQLGYQGDVEDKMFKAGRYYFREKVALTTPKAPTLTTPKVNVNEIKVKATREYIVMAPHVIQAMDKHLLAIMKNKDFKPALGYTQFCDEQLELLKVEVRRLMGENKCSMDSDKLAAKIKKTYKNRYFILSKEITTTTKQD